MNQDKFYEAISSIHGGDFTVQHKPVYVLNIIRERPKSKTKQNSFVYSVNIY